MERQQILSPDAPAPIGPYSQAIMIGDDLYCSGQVGIDPASGQLVEGGITAETLRTLDNIGALLGSAGYDFDDVIKTTIFLIDMTDFAAVNALYEPFFTASKPARSTVAVAALPKGARIEIEVLARK